jgi:hypothetical protein
VTSTGWRNTLCFIFFNTLTVQACAFPISQVISVKSIITLLIVLVCKAGNVNVDYKLSAFKYFVPKDTAAPGNGLNWFLNNS